MKSYDDDVDQEAKVQDEPVAAVVAPSSPKKISDEAWSNAIGAWVDQYLRSTPVTQTSEGWNHLVSVIPRLRELLEAEL